MQKIGVQIENWQSYVDFKIFLGSAQEIWIAQLLFLSSFFKTDSRIKKNGSMQSEWVIFL